ncbi:copper homeostasis protein CutC [Moorella naiadis]|uniref:copper homeostasis protein CutC n=1 Tax=Moorella naiadis (nom. illeg.) TaxID=3093670 RepID=UPI003D9C7E46
MVTQTEVIMEVIALTLEDVAIAQDNGADRIELACGLAEGALTPSYGFMAEARRISKISIFTMIRPRHGDFNYSPAEIAAMRQDIKAAKDTGMDGVILGVLDSQGEVNLAAMVELVAAAEPLPVTFHRAFDMAANPYRTLEQLLQYKGVKRLLTSGRAGSTQEGAPLIRELQVRAGSNICVMPGMGITPANVAAAIQATGAREVHLGVGLRTPADPLGQLDAGKVRAARRALDNIIGRSPVKGDEYCTNE